ncbi:MAG: hypothetical protein JO247_17135 [Chloroflexi bacterium]|nr:hypothetical protein [Chloroflexota bacterium]
MPGGDDWMAKAKAGELKATNEGWKDAARDYKTAAWRYLEHGPPDLDGVRTAWQRARVVLHKITPDTELEKFAEELLSDGQLSHTSAGKLLADGEIEAATETFTRAACEAQLSGEAYAILAQELPQLYEAAGTTGRASLSFIYAAECFEEAAANEGDSAKEAAEKKAEFALAGLARRSSVTQSLEGAHYYDVLGDAGLEASYLTGATDQTPLIDADEAKAQ